MYIISIFIGFLSIFLPNFLVFFLYKIFLKNKKNSSKKILLFLYLFEVSKILLFIVLCIFALKYVTIIKSWYFISVCFVQFVFFGFFFKKAYKDV